jgi:3'-phosphoadenosine 5'-phosphosulfate sulfotransferase (PAPS reductase)/FAD synthetase
MVDGMPLFSGIYVRAVIMRRDVLNRRLRLYQPETRAQEDPEKLLFMSDPDRCCDIRKVRPLAAAIEVYDA